MDLRALKYFVAIKETGSLSQAAKSCFVAQPSISSALVQLEKTVGKPLFVRHSRGVDTTEAAEKLYPLAKQLLGQANAIQQMFKESTDKSRFRLGLVKGLGVARMSALLQQFTAGNEHMELMLVPPEDKCDARIISKQMLKPNEQFTSMWREEFSVALPMGHPLSLKHTLNLVDLRDLDFIERTPCEAWEQLQSALIKTGLQLDIRAKIQTIEYAIGLVDAGVGCTLLPDYIELEPKHHIVKKHISDLTMSRHIGLAFEESSRLTDSLKRLVSKQFSR